MIAATEDETEERDSHSTLSGIKEKLLVTDLINQLEIADGLKEVLIRSGFTLKSLLNASASDFTIFGIDQYIAKLVSDAVKKVVRHQHSIVKLEAYNYDQFWETGSYSSL